MRTAARRVLILPTFALAVWAVVMIGYALCLCADEITTLMTPGD